MASVTRVFSSLILISLLVTHGAAGQKNRATNPPPALRLAPCGDSGPRARLRCGHLDVFENRALKSGRKISLNIMVIPSVSKTPEPDPVFLFAGGPGGGVVGGGGSNAQLAGILAHRDVVLVDQRGTGGSHPLKCAADPASFKIQDFFDDSGASLAARARACRAELEKDADLTQYTTPIAMDDLDDVRAAFGYERINLYGLSYGTRAALVYVRQHPEHVRAAVLVAVDPPATKIPLSAARGMQHALDHVFDACASESACHTAYPDLKTEFEDALRALEKSSAKFQAVNKTTGKTESVNLSRQMFGARLVYLFYGPSQVRLVPYFIHQASLGNFSDFVSRIAAEQAQTDVGLARGMYYSVICSEDIPFISDFDLARETSGTVMGTALVENTRKACEQWPRGNVSPDYERPISSDAPVLLLSGEYDPVTPPWFAKDVSAHMQNSLAVTAPSVGHGIISRCAFSMAAEFFEKGTTKSLDTSCTTELPRLNFLTDPAEAAKLFGSDSRGGN